MFFRHWKPWLLGGLVAAGALTSGGRANAQQELPPQPQAAELRLDNVRTYAYVETQPLGEYWIGIGLGELPDVAKKQLSLEHGLVVEDVYPDSPAAKAEFKQHDILLKAGDKQLQEPADIQNAVEEAKETELSVVVLREGKETTLKVVPIKRPQRQVAEVTRTEAAPSNELRLEIQRLEEALQRLKIHAGGGENPLGIWFARPPVVARAVTAKPAEFPEDLNLRIVKEGGKPAKIYVTKDDKEWETTEDKLDELPENVRGHVQQMLARPLTRYRLEQVHGGGTPITLPGPPHTVRVGPDGKVQGEIHVQPPQLARNPNVLLPSYLPATAAHGGGVEAKLDAILKKLGETDTSAIEQLRSEVKQLRQELDEFRGKSPDDKR
jgi:hypothetical protein